MLPPPLLQCPLLPRKIFHKIYHIYPLLLGVDILIPATLQIKKLYAKSVKIGVVDHVLQTVKQTIEELDLIYIKGEQSDLENAFKYVQFMNLRKLELRGLIDNNVCLILKGCSSTIESFVWEHQPKYKYSEWENDHYPTDFDPNILCEIKPRLVNMDLIYIPQNIAEMLIKSSSQSLKYLQLSLPEFMEKEWHRKLNLDQVKLQLIKLTAKDLCLDNVAVLLNCTGETLQSFEYSHYQMETFQPDDDLFSEIIGKQMDRIELPYLKYFKAMNVSSSIVGPVLVASQETLQNLTLSNISRKRHLLKEPIQLKKLRNFIATQVHPSHVEYIIRSCHESLKEINLVKIKRNLTSPDWMNSMKNLQLTHLQIYETCGDVVVTIIENCYHSLQSIFMEDCNFKNEDIKRLESIKLNKLGTLRFVCIPTSVVNVLIKCSSQTLKKLGWFSNQKPVYGLKRIGARGEELDGKIDLEDRQLQLTSFVAGDIPAVYAAALIKASRSTLEWLSLQNIYGKRLKASENRAYQSRKYAYGYKVFIIILV